MVTDDEPGPRASWPADTRVPLDLRPVGAVLVDWAEHTPDARALGWEEPDGSLRWWTYAEVAERATEMARRLLAIVGPGEPVAVWAAPSPDWYVLEYGAALAGTPLVPMNPAFTDAEIEHILASSGARLVVCDVTFRGSGLLDRARALAGPTAPATVVELAAWRGLATTEAPLPEVAAADTFLVQFTSGTTGRPKGAVLGHLAAYNCARLSTMLLEVGPGDVWLNVMPMHHVGGSVSVALAMLSVGAAVFVVPAFEPGKVLELLERSRASIIGAVPTMQLAMLAHPSFATTDLAALRIVQSGGTTVPPSLIRRVEDEFGVVVVNAYGQSESPNAIMTSPTDPDEMKAATIGRAMPQRELRIAGPDGSPVGFGEPGELWMRSPLVMDGYVGVDPETARRTLDADGWLHTGDLCSMDATGVVSIVGRVRDVVIRGGENIYPAELEDVLLQHPDIADVAVVGVPDDRWGEVPVACYVPRGDATPEAADLEAFARARLASFKVPRRWVRLAAFPLTASGKVKRFELRAAVEPGVDGGLGT